MKSSLKELLWALILVEKTYKLSLYAIGGITLTNHRMIMKDLITTYFTRKPERLMIILLLVIAASYSNSIYSPFILDDTHSFINDSSVYVDNISWESLKKLASTKFGIPRLIPMITFAIDHRIFSVTNNLSQYHITNIVIHLLATCAVYFLLTSILSIKSLSNKLSFFNIKCFAIITTAIWALSPVQINAVTYIVQRMTSLCALFYFMSVGCYIRARIKQSQYSLYYWILFVIFSIFSLLSKEISATLPLILFLIEYAFLSQNKINMWVKSFKYQHIVLLLLLMAIASLFLWPTINNFLTRYDTRNFNLLERLLTESRVIIFYISIVLLPLISRLNLEHDFAVSTGLLTPPNTILSIALIVILLSFAILNINRYKLLSFGILFFFITNIVESTIIPLELVFEHRLYLPSLGLIISIIMALDNILYRLTNRNHDTFIVTGIFFVIICSIFSLTTTMRNNTWRDINSIYEDIYTKSPNQLRSMSQYAQTLYKLGSKDEAIYLLDQCIDISTPTNDELVTCATNLMGIYIADDQANEAIEVFKKANSKNLAKYNAASAGLLVANLSFALKSKGELDAAIEATKTALLMPNDDYNENRMLNNLTLYLYEKASKNIFPNKDKKDLTVDEYFQVMNIILIDRIKNLILARRYNEALQTINNSKDISSDLEDQKTKILHIIAANKTHKNQYKVQSHTSTNKSWSYKTTVILTDYVLKNYKTSFSLIDKTIAKQLTKHPNDIFLKYLLAKSSFLQGKPKLAESISEEILAKTDDFAPVIDFLFKLKLHLKESQEAKELCRRLLRVYPGHVNWKAYTFYTNNRRGDEM